MQKRRKAQWKFGRVAKIRNLQNFATLLPSLTAFLPALFGFVKIFPLCNFGSFINFCNFLGTEHLYELSQACNINQLSVHQSLNKIGHQVSSPPAGV